MSPVKWRMLDVLLTDAIDATPAFTADWYHLRVAREIVRDHLDTKKLPHKPHLHHKMQS